MMKIAKKAERALDRKKETEQKNRDTVLLILSVGFLVGGVLGCLLEGKLSTEHYIGQFFQQAAQMSIAPSLWREVWIVFRWPVAVILFPPLSAGGTPETEAPTPKLLASVLAAADAASDVTRRAVQLFGGYGYTREYPMERMMRDAKITEIYEGTSEVQRMVISANLGVN